MVKYTLETKKKLGLAGILLGVTTLQNCSTPRQYVANTISGTEYSDFKGNESYNLEGQVLFKTGNKKLDVPYFFAKNKDWGNGELNFVLYKADESKIVSSYDGKKTEIKGQEYIPTKLNIKGKIATEFELENISAKIKKKLLNKKRTGSKNSFGYNFITNNKDIKEILPLIKIGNKDYLYVNGDLGRFGADENGKKEHGYLNSSLPEVFIPVNKNKVGIGVNPVTGEISIESEQGFYGLFKESEQEKLPGKTTSKPKTETFKHKIQKGEQGLIISKEYGIDFKELQRANPQVKDWTKIRPGQYLNIPKK